MSMCRRTRLKHLAALNKILIIKKTKEIAEHVEIGK